MTPQTNLRAVLSGDPGQFSRRRTRHPYQRRVRRRQHTARRPHQSANGKHEATFALLTAVKAPRGPHARDALFEFLKITRRHVNPSTSPCPVSKTMQSEPYASAKPFAPPWPERGDVGPPTRTLRNAPMVAALNSEASALRSLRADASGRDCEFTNCCANPAPIKRNRIRTHCTLVAASVFTKPRTQRARARPKAGKRSSGPGGNRTRRDRNIFALR